MEVAMARLRVVGIGSDHGDDRLGWLACERLAAAPLPEGVEVVRCERFVADLLRLLRDAERVILVDAIRSGRPPGHLHRAGREALAELGAPLSSHGLDLHQLLALAEAVGEAPRELRLYGLEAAECGPGGELSPAVAAALPGLLEALRGELTAAG